jgi:hypothetical protein
MNNNLLDKLEQMASLMQEVSVEWEKLSNDDKLVEKYPFDKSFDEVVQDVKEWVEQTKK